MCGQVDSQQIITADKQLGYEEIEYDGESSAKKIISDAISSTRNNFEFDVCMLKESATMYKHYSFHEENEVRITYTPKKTEEKVTGLSKKFRYQNNTIIPYYEFDFCYSGIKPKLEIILGPNCKLIKNDLEDFLKYYGFESFDIDYSESSYRHGK